MTQPKTKRKKNIPTEQRGYPCYSAPGPGPQVHDVHDDTKSHYNESFLPLYQVSRQKAATLFAQVGNSPICHSKVPYGSVPQL